MLKQDNKFSECGFRGGKRDQTSLHPWFVTFFVCMSGFCFCLCFVFLWISMFVSWMISFHYLFFLFVKSGLQSLLKEFCCTSGGDRGGLTRGLHKSIIHTLMHTSYTPTTCCWTPAANISWTFRQFTTSTSNFPISVLSLENEAAANLPPIFCTVISHVRHFSVCFTFYPSEKTWWCFWKPRLHIMSSNLQCQMVRPNQKFTDVAWKI